SVSIAMLGANAVYASSVLFNAGFASGSLDGWTPFTTSNGTLGVNMPTVVPFTVDGDPPDYADWQGGGVRQSVALNGSPFSLSVDVGVRGNDIGNLFGGWAQPLLDSMIVAEHDFGPVNPDELLTSHLNHATVNLEAPGTHLIAIQFLRPTIVMSGNPMQFATNFNLQ